MLNFWGGIWSWPTTICGRDFKCLGAIIMGHLGVFAAMSQQVKGAAALNDGVFMLFWLRPDTRHFGRAVQPQ